jgi:hypothetical protein
MKIMWRAMSPIRGLGGSVMKRITLLVLTLALLPSAVAAQEQPHNDPLAIISNRPRPNVLMLIDTSGSMLWDSNKPGGSDITVRKESSLQDANINYNIGSHTHKCYIIDSDNPKSRIGQAKSAIREIISQIPDVNVGIGRFKKTLTLNRFRARVPADFDETLVEPISYRFEYWDDQVPSPGQINIPWRRHHGESGNYEYPYARVIRRYNVSGAYAYWTVYDPADVVWSLSTANTQTIGGYLYIRLNWDITEINYSRYMQYRALTDAGDQIFRGTYAAPTATQRNKLNQVDNIDIFLSDEEFIQLKENTPLDQPLTVQRYVESAYGVDIGQTLTFTYFPTCADWDGNTSCAGGEVLVGIQDDFQDDPETAEDESDNKEEVSATAGPVITNAKIYDFSVDPVQLTDLGSFYGMGGTPIGDTLQAARDYYEQTIIPRDQSNIVDHCRENYVILLTDGYETCGGSPETVASYLYDNLGIKVYVIAFVTTTAQADAIAVAGGSEAAFRAENKEQLIDALKSIFTEIKAAVQLSAPVAASSGRSAENVVEGDIALLPFFDFPGFFGRLQARRIFKNCVVAVDEKTGAIVTDADGNPQIIEDDITEARILELINDPDDPIEKDPSREIVGVQLDPPDFLWDAGELLSQTYIESENPDLTYDYLKADAGDLDGDGNTSETIANPAYQAADSRRVLTAISYADRPTVINFNETDLVDNASNKAAAKTLMGISAWSDAEMRFLINYFRGKNVRRFTEATTIYGRLFSPGDPMPDPASPDNNGDGVPDRYLYTERTWKLGDIVTSTPIVITPPKGTFPVVIDDNNSTADTNDFEDFIAAKANIPSIVVVGANDGLLHAFSLVGIDGNRDGDFDDAGEYYPGEEVWAFMLPDLMGKLKELYSDSVDDDDFEPDGQLLNPHQYFQDAMVTLAIVRARVHTGDTDGDGKTDDPEFRIMMLLGEGRGGYRYWAFDVTDPMNPKPIWNVTDASMGMTLSRPAVGPIEVGASSELDNDTFKYFVFMGSGYNYSQTDGSAAVGNVVYKVDINNGDIVDYFSAGDESGGADIPNAVVGRPIMVDEDDDFFIERVYFGDLDGNIWRWNLVDGSKVNILNDDSEPLTTENERLERPISDSLTVANIFGFQIVSVATGGDTRRYLDAQAHRADYPAQKVYLIVDTDREGRIRSLLNGEINDDGEYEETSDTVGIELKDYQVAENIPVITAFTEYNEEGKIYRGFQTFYPLYTPDPAGLWTIRCTFGSSDLLVLDSIFGESNIVESTSGLMIGMGEGKATGITYVGGNILFSIGDQFKVYGSGIYRFEGNIRVEAKLKVLRWKEL